MKSAVAHDLHALIHTMGQHEKRYFKMYAGVAGKRASNNYVDLFDVLHRMAVFSNEVLEKKVVGKRYESSISSTLTHLFALVLKSLKSCNAKHSVRQEVKDLLASAELLSGRGLHAAAMRLVRRAVRKSRKMGAHLELVEAVAVERRLLFQLRSRGLYEEVELRKEQTLSILEQVTVELHLEALEDQQLALRLSRLDSRGGGEMAALNRLMTAAVLCEDPPAEPRAAAIYHSIHGNNRLINKNHDRAYKHLESCVGFREKELEVYGIYSPTHLRNLTDLLNACLYSMRWLEAENVLAKIRSIPISTLEQESLLINQTLYTTLLLYLNAGRYKEGIGVVEKIEELLGKKSVKVSIGREMTYCYNITIFYFIQEDYAASLRWLNRLLQFQGVGLKQHLQDFARLFQLVLHFELGNLDLLEYLFRSALRFYKSRKALYPFEELIFAALGRMMQMEEPVEKISKELYDGLWQVAREMNGKEPSGLYELIFWAQSKAEKLSLRKVFQKRVNERMALVLAKEKGEDQDVLKALEDRELR